MKVLFVARHSGYVRNFESTLRLLLERGHRVHVAFETGVTHQLLDPANITQQLADSFPNLTYGPAPGRDLDVDQWGALGRKLRFSVDYLRYVDSRYRDAHKLRARAARRAPGVIQALVEKRGFRHPLAVRTLSTALRLSESAIPRNAEVDAFLREQRPDILLITPLVEIGAPQADFVRGARALGVRAVLCVASWDNLTNKGVIQDMPDLITVWNESMKREAIELHDAVPGRVVVTGAQPYDHWFNWQASTSSESFRQRVGLAPDHPFVLYVCSSKFIAPEETGFVRRWIAFLREHPDRRLRKLGVLVRPHPQNASQWQRDDLADLANVTIWPRAGANPVDEGSRNEYFDSIYHSAGVVGINTSALIESAIVDRPVYTVLAPEFRDTQGGTLHFSHLLHVNGGLLHVAETVEEHARQLLQALEEPGLQSAQNRQFLKAFVRPHGLDRPATPILVAAIEAAAARPSPRPRGLPFWAPLAQLALARLTSPEGLKRRPEVREKVRAGFEDSPLAATVDQLAARFRALPPEARDAFLQQTQDLLPRKVKASMSGKAAPKGVPNGRVAQAPDGTAGRDANGLVMTRGRLDYADAEIYMRVTSKREKMRLRACRKEPWTIQWIERWIQAGEVLYDVGANVGAYSLIAAKSVGARVVAFEPGYANYGALCENVMLNGLSDSITPLPTGLAAHTRMSAFEYTDVQPGAAQHALVEVAPITAFTPIFRQPVMTHRLDDLIEQFDLPEPNHIKIDVDGAEMAVLDGARRTLDNPALRSVLIEVFVNQADEVMRELAVHGLHLDQKHERVNKAGQVLVWYGIFNRASVTDRAASG